MPRAQGCAGAARHLSYCHRPSAGPQGLYITDPPRHIKPKRNLQSGDQGCRFLPSHASVVAETHQRDKLECLCRYVSRPAVSEQRDSA
jgi:Putative transposase